MSASELIHPTTDPAADPAAERTTDDSGTGPAIGASRLRIQHQALIRGSLNRLEQEFGHLLTRETLQRYLDESYADLMSRCRVATHVPTFVERFTRQRLQALARNRGLAIDHRPEVLFVCRRNDAVSQMAAALFRELAGGRATAHSAGAEPADDLLEAAVHALHEVGIEVLDEFPKPVTPEIEEAADVIVTLDAGDGITVVDGRRSEAWSVAAHEGGGLDVYRALRHELTGKVEDLLDRLAPATPTLRRADMDGDLEELSAMVARMGRAVLDMIEGEAEALGAGDGAGHSRVPQADARVDAAHRAVANRVVEVIALRQPVAGDLRALLALASTALHLERVADCMVDVAIIGLGGGLDPEDGIPGQLVEMLSLVETMTGDALASVVDRTTDGINWIIDMDRRLDALHGEVFAWLAEGRAGDDPVAAVEMDRASRSVKRAGEHALDIAEQAIYAETGELRELGR